MEQRLSALIRAFLRGGKASTHAPYFTASQHAQHALRDAIATLLEQGQRIGIQHAQAMVGKEERGVFNGLKDIVARAKDIVDGIMDHVRDAIEAALNNDEDVEEALSQSDIVDMTMNELIDELPELIAETEIQNAVESTVVEEIKNQGFNAINWHANPDACDLCKANEAASPIRIDSDAPSGDTAPPAHPRCRCTTSPAHIDD